ncbi:glycosyltransferase family 4 protein [Mycetocola zhadangensis]|uniref:glycosyltransferase family 4 protein n=1 Tax=Mycetocola zhadangensis TaxID=1164595 RepID=UPI003A4D31CE
MGRIPAGGHPQITMFRETLAALQRGKPGDILHYVADTGPLVQTRRPSVVTVHGVASRWIDTARTPSQDAVWRTRVRRAIDATERIITVSHSSADDVQNVFDVSPDRITTIYHGIDVEKFSARTELSDELATRLPLKFALYLGNIEPRKNLVELVRAFDRPELKAMGVPLVIAGKPAWNSEDSMRAISRSENVHHLGFVSDLDRVALMQACAVFVFPSLYEGFGFPVLEALSAGAVVTTSRRGSLAEVSGPALELQDLSAEGIASGVIDALTNTKARSDCRVSGLSWASQFTWDESVDKHVEVYKSLAAA